MLDAGGKAFRAATDSWNRTVRHGTSIVLIPVDCTLGGETVTIGDWRFGEENEYQSPA